MPAATSSMLIASVILMACVGAAHGLFALLIGPIFDRVLNPARADAPVLLFSDPDLPSRLSICDQIVPAWIHNVWTMVAFAILMVFLVKGVCDYFGNYLINYAGVSAVTDLRNASSTRCCGRARSFSKPTRPDG